MKSTLTARIYFEYGDTVKGLPFWQNIWDNSFGSALMRKAKSAGIGQAINFNVTAGYLNQQSVNRISEVKNPRFPQCFEITDDHDKISEFIKKETAFLSRSTVLLASQQDVVIIDKKEI